MMPPWAGRLWGGGEGKGWEAEGIRASRGWECESRVAISLSFSLCFSIVKDEERGG
jgi:hypothetical protein